MPPLDCQIPPFSRNNAWGGGVLLWKVSRDTNNIISNGSFIISIKIDYLKLIIQHLQQVKRVKKQFTTACTKFNQSDLPKLRLQHIAFMTSTNVYMIPSVRFRYALKLKGKQICLQLAKLRFKATFVISHFNSLRCESNDNFASALLSAIKTTKTLKINDKHLKILLLMKF